MSSEKPPLPKQLQSYVSTKDGVWDKRKISIWGVARSVVSQLRAGDDMTKVSLPAVFLSPFSALELGADRFLAFFDILNIGEQNKAKEAGLQRLVTVLRWYLASYAELEFEKKPYNPVLGETHQCNIRLGEDNSKSAFYVGEQVLHHPPVTAFAVHNPHSDCTIEGNITFGVKFHGNSVTMETKGAAFITIGDEVYKLSKAMPDILISNVIIGSRTMNWFGEIEISCEKSGFRATMQFKKKKKSIVIGSIYNKNYKNGDEPQYTFEGTWCDEAIYAVPAEESKEPVFISDFKMMQKNTIEYPPTEAMEEMDSLKVWYEVSKQIFADDLTKADLAKQTIETAQRVRIKEGAEALDKPRKYFVHDAASDFWRWNGVSSTGNDWKTHLHARAASPAPESKREKKHKKKHKRNASAGQNDKASVATEAN